MAQFDVFRLSDGSLVIDCQSDLIYGYETRIVAPLIEPEDGAVLMPRLHPRFTIGGEEFVMVTQFVTAIRIQELRLKVETLAHERDRIIGAIDVLTGSG
jgi:toxin CcdB